MEKMIIRAIKSGVGFEAIVDMQKEAGITDIRLDELRIEAEKQ